MDVRYVPRPYQAACIDAIYDAFDVQQKQSTLVVAATGTGKTAVFSFTADRWVKDPARHGKVLTLVHREELAFQAKEKLQAIVGNLVELEMGEYRVGPRGLLSATEVVVASVQSLSRESRLNRYDPGEFGLVIVDEAHHCVPKCRTYMSILDHFRRNERLKVLGVTATPDRADEEALGQVFESVAFEYEITDAIKDGWLVPVRQQFVVVEDLDFSSVRTTAGDLNAGDLDRIMSEEKMLHRVVAPTIEIAAGRPTLVFAPSVDSAQEMCDVFNRHSLGSAVCIHGGTETEQRRYELGRFSRGEFHILVGCAVFTEGFDAPRVSVVAMARPTKSRSLYAQMVGRGTRPLPGTVDGLATPAERRRAVASSAKPDCLVIDFVGNSGRHKLVTTADILGGKESDEIVERAAERAKAKAKDGVAPDMIEEIEAAKREMEEHRRRERQGIIAKARFAARDIDPFDLFDITAGREPGYLLGKQPTDKQLAWLRQNARGVNLSDLTFHKASKLIEGLKQRAADGRCTPQQAQVLARYGRPANVTIAEARQMIAEINESLRLTPIGGN